MGKGSSGSSEVKETAYQKELARVAAEQWNDYQDTFVPIEQEYTRITSKMDDHEQYEKISGDVNTSFNSSYAEAKDRISDSMASSGIDPSSGKSFSEQTNIIEDKLGRKNQASSAGNHNVTQRYTGNLQNVVAMGKGKQTAATAGLNDIAAASGRLASESAISKAKEVSIPAVALGVGASAFASNPEWASGAFESIDNSVTDKFGSETLPADNNVGYGLVNV